MKHPRDSEKALSRDVRDAILLGAYIRAWGPPRVRVKSVREDDDVAVYVFGGKSDFQRFATVGVSALRRDDGSSADWELLAVLPSSLAGASVEEVTNFILDLMAYSLRADVRIAPGETIPPSPLMPVSWVPRAILLDEPRGEAEELVHFQIGSQLVHLIWAIPIYKQELELIVQSGLEAFDQLQRLAEWSLVDPDRPALGSSTASG